METIKKINSNNKKCNQTCGKCKAKLPMQTYLTMKKAGIWLDFKEAFIYYLADDEIITQHIVSEIEDYHVVGGSRAKNVYGASDTVSEKKYLERRKQQQNRYYDKIMEALKDMDLLFLFGPAEAKKGLESKMEATKSFQPRILAVESSDSVTDNQKLAKVKSYFKV